MSVKTIRPAGNLGSAQSEDAYSAGIWHDCPLLAIRDGELPGIVQEFNFDTLPKTPPTTEGNFGDFAAFTDTGGFINAIAGHGWNLGSDGDNEGASFRTRATPFKIIRTGKKFWFETRVKFSTIADTKNGVFIGLLEDVALTATVPIAAAGTLADKNFVGFHRLEGDGDAIDTVYKADGVTQVTVGADALTIAADTWVKLGMVFEPGIDPTIHDVANSGTKLYNLAFYSNGIRLATVKQIPSAAGTDFPNDIYMGFAMAILNATGSSPGDASISRARIAQLF